MRAPSDAFSDRLNSTPAKCQEADRFRVADDRLKALSSAAFAALRATAKEEMPPEIQGVLESWCLLHGETPVSVERCAELAADVEEFRLVGLSSLSYLSPEERGQLTSKVEGLDSAALSQRPTPVAEPAAAMLEWLQAALALSQWAEEARKSES